MFTWIHSADQSRFVSKGYKMNQTADLQSRHGHFELHFFSFFFSAIKGQIDSLSRLTYKNSLLSVWTLFQIFLAVFSPYALSL